MLKCGHVSRSGRRAVATAQTVVAASVYTRNNPMNIMLTLYKTSSSASRSVR